MSSVNLHNCTRSHIDADFYHRAGGVRGPLVPPVTHHPVRRGVRSGTFTPINLNMLTSDVLSQVMLTEVAWCPRQPVYSHAVGPGRKITTRNSDVTRPGGTWWWWELEGPGRGGLTGGSGWRETEE
ncbi:hypothetical protein Pmani_034310 [Petrolisthes manimaculis]|uniref:Uncharacterized protein n=1 Tax=Petrolisthes manimaculis TaxID=1843537 RepID=A0AAE1TPA0_9EUCA|nr:hypothetical protein Pmani_034310 [Petrolisthes manimaculis]